MAIIEAHLRTIDCHTMRRTAASSQVCRGVVVHLLSALTIRWLLAVQPSNGGVIMSAESLTAWTFGVRHAKQIPLAARSYSI